MTNPLDTFKVTGERLLESGSAFISSSLGKLLEQFNIRARGDNRPTFGIALCGGGARGIAYVGLFRFFEEHHVRPDVIAGTSIGSLMGALYADGMTSQEILKIVSQMGFHSMTSLVRPRLSILKTDKYRQFVADHLHSQRIEDLPIPLSIVATNLQEVRARVFTEGNLADCVTASCSIPLLFRPITIDGDQYVDGGVFMNLPARPIREKCDFLLGFDLSPEVGEAESKNMLQLSNRLIRIMMRANMQEDYDLCDVVIRSSVLSRVSAYDVRQADRLADIGYQLINNVYQENEAFRSIIDLLSDPTQ